MNEDTGKSIDDAAEHGFSKFKGDMVDKLVALYAQREIENLEFQVRLASKNISIGKELIEIEKFMTKESLSYEFEMIEWFLGENGEQIIDPKDRNLCKRIAELEDIGSYLWLGWENILKIVESIDLRTKFKFKNILEELNVDENNSSINKINDILNRIQHYKTYKEVKKLNNHVTFKAVFDGIKKGIDFYGEEIRELIKDSTTRPDRTIMNYANKKEKSMHIISSTKNKRSLFDNIEVLMVKLTEALRIACVKGEYPRSLDSYIQFKFIQNVIDADCLLEYGIIEDMYNNDEPTNDIVLRLIKEMKL